MTWEWLRPKPLSRLKFLGYVGFTVPRFGMRPLSKLGLRLHLTCGRWRMYTTLLPSEKLPPSNSEARDVLEEAEAAGLEAVVATIAPDEPARESELSGVVEISSGLSSEAPQKTVESIADAQAPHAEEPALLVEPLQTVPPGEGSKHPEIASTQLSKEGIKTKSKK